MSDPSKKAAPFSIRLSQATDKLVTAEARRTKRSRSAIVEAFTEETARARRFPGIAFRGDDASRRAWVVGSGLDVWEIIHMLEDFGTVERLVRDTHLNEPQVGLAQVYRDEHPREIAEAIKENRRPISELRELYPFIAR
ncbi:MAG TPA: ribbon-helix-helix protein, CopG family [Actinomycetota bacterium]